MHCRSAIAVNNWPQPRTYDAPPTTGTCATRGADEAVDSKEALAEQDRTRDVADSAVECSSLADGPLEDSGTDTGIEGAAVDRDCRRVGS